MSRAQMLRPGSIRTFPLFDFTRKLPAGVTLAGSPSLEELTGDIDPFVFVSTAGAVVSVQIGAGSGTLGVTYKLTCRHPATNAELLELDAFVVITSAFKERNGKKWEKQPDEERILTLDFTPELVLGAALTGTPAMVLEAGPTHGSLSRGDTTVSTMISGGALNGGALNQRYQGVCECDVTNGDHLVIPFHLHIKE